MYWCMMQTLSQPVALNWQQLKKCVDLGDHKYPTNARKYPHITEVVVLAEKNIFAR